MTAQAFMLSALATSIYKGSGSLKDFLPESVQFVDYKPPTQKPKRGADLAGWLAGLHQSWMAPFIGQLAEPLKPYFTEEKALAPAVSEFLRQILFTHLADPDILPFSLLPASPLDPLLFISQARVMHLIDLLGIHDLALDFKRVIAKEQQMALEALLTPLQKQYFSYCIKESLIPLQQDKPAQFWLEHKNPQSLIHSAGLWRLTRLISAEEKSWQWYFLHYIDKPRGTQMQKWIEEDKAIALQGKARDKVLEQVLRLVEALK